MNGELRESYSPDVGGDEDDDGDGTEPGVSDGEQDVPRHVRAGEVPQSEGNHTEGERKRDQIKNPHFSSSLFLFLPPSGSGSGSERLGRRIEVRDGGHGKIVDAGWVNKERSV